MFGHLCLSHCVAISSISWMYMLYFCAQKCVKINLTEPVHICVVRVWPHSASVRWGKGLLHLLLCDWDPIHPLVPDCCGAEGDGVQHSTACSLHTAPLGSVQVSGDKCACSFVSCHHCLQLLPHPCCNLLCNGRGLELPGVFLLLLYLTQYHWPGWLRARRGL